MLGGDTCRNSKEYLLPLDKSPKVVQMSEIDLEGSKKFPMSLQGLGGPNEEVWLLPPLEDATGIEGSGGVVDGEAASVSDPQSVNKD